MGADGGINWVRVKDRETFLRLVQPFNLGWVHGHPYDGHHYEYLQTCPLPSDFVVSTYGTNQDVQGFYTLQEMLREAEYLEDLQVDEAATFGDLLLSEYTAPSWLGGGGGSTIVFALLGFHTRRYSNNPAFSAQLKEYRDRKILETVEKAKGDPVLRMIVRQWAKAVNNAIYPKSFGSAETWT